jgi:glycosyltransferase involved in cell wall biosynthesis
MPKVSVVTAVYNGRKYLRETVRSILDQTFTDLEYILVDDGSTDDSVEIIRSLNDPRVRLFVNEQNRRLVYTRNRGIAEARGQYIALTDHDDISLPTRLADQVRFLDANPDFGLVATWFDYINLTGEPVARRARRRYTSDECRASLLYRNMFGNSTLMVRREAIPDPPYAPEFPICEDYHFIVQVSRKYRICLLPKVSVHYRLTTESYSNYAGSQTFLLGRILKRQLLGDLGAEPTERELEIHHNLEMHHLPLDANVVRETRIWLERLVAANSRSRTYDPQAFANITGNEWFEFCRASSRLGAAHWGQFRGSSLAQTSHYGNAARLRLLLKCVLGDARRIYSAAR